MSLVPTAEDKAYERGYYAGLRASEARVTALEKALAPFADVGRLVDELYFPAVFRDNEDAFQSGCTWKENGERKTLKWGDFRRAREALLGEEKR
jgi:hypothetical protein